jgi:hypothetical protein
MLGLQSFEVLMFPGISSQMKPAPVNILQSRKISLPEFLDSRKYIPYF